MSRTVQTKAKIKTTTYVASCGSLLSDSASLLSEVEAKVLAENEKEIKGLPTSIPITFLHLWPRLMPFQKEGVAFAINKYGRACICDEMGLGKTIQAIAVASYFEQDRPALIIVPASVKLSWKAEIETWCPLLSSESIVVVKGRADIEPLNQIIVNKVPAFIIMTYSHFVNGSPVAERISQVNLTTVILDESHYIKQKKSQRTQIITQLMLKARRLILLSGTPALARPVELYPQISVVRSQLFGSYTHFTNRFCNGHRGRFGDWDVSGASNLTELNTLLKQIMIRRLKKDVLKDLPPKRRSRCYVTLTTKAQKEMSKFGKALRETQKRSTSSSGLSQEEAFEAKKLHRQMLVQAYQATGEAKIPGICEYLTDLLESAGDNKILLFAYHLSVLDGIEQHCAKHSIGSMRIDGSVSAEERFRRVEMFQSDANVRIAILGITAAGQGITLTAASTVVFAELHWTPGMILQAEDRAHRIGQQNPVNIIYLLAEGQDCLDSMMWGCIGHKLTVVGRALDGNAEDNSGRIAARWVANSSEGDSEIFEGIEEDDEEEREEGDLRSFFQPSTKPCTVSSISSSQSSASSTLSSSSTSASTLLSSSIQSSSSPMKKSKPISNREPLSQNITQFFSSSSSSSSSSPVRLLSSSSSSSLSQLSQPPQKHEATFVYHWDCAQCTFTNSIPAHRVALQSTVSFFSSSSSSSSQNKKQKTSTAYYPCTMCGYKSCCQETKLRSSLTTE